MNLKGKWMARINVEDEIGNDPRFIRLLMNLKGDYYKALGFCVGAWRMGQKYYKDVEAKGIIPFEEWDQTEFGANFVECGLAVKTENGIYVKGSKDKFAWLDQKSEAGKIGGKKSAESRGNKLKQNEAYASTCSSETKQNEAYASTCSSETKRDPSTTQAESSEGQAEPSETKPLTLPPPLALVLPPPGVITNTYPPNPLGEFRGSVSALEKTGAEIKAELDRLGVTITPDHVIDLFNSKLARTGKLLHCRGLGAPSQKQMLNTFAKLQKLSDWEELFLKVKSLDKLTGIRPGVFLATLDWLSIEENALKVLSGKYDNTTENQQSQMGTYDLTDDEIEQLREAGEL